MPVSKHCLNTRFVSVGLVVLVAQVALGAALQTASAESKLRDLNTPRQFPEISSREQWEQRAKEIREQVLVSCGLWPMPEKPPLKAHIFDKVKRDGYSVEKVYFQSLPGFYVAGNLYRPLGRGRGPFPGILNPHGHWKEGRLTDNKEGSVPARCISFARQGMVAFAYDMVGFNDTHFAGAPMNRPFYDIHRQFGTNRSDLLWNISLMGLQTWDSIRALDFLASLPDVDRKRLACTGASGGGTQTYMLGAIDDRLAAQAPVVMVSHTMQGGCSCENAPGLRVEYSNVEIAAAAAPRPQILVGATGDWTQATLTMEGPALAQIYQLFGAPDRLRYVRFDFKHNYNQTSREAVYDWFGRWLLKNADAASLKEAPYEKVPDAVLRVFPDGKLPDDALSQEQFIESLKRLHEAEWQSLAPRNAASLEHYRQVMLPAWRHTLQVAWPDMEVQTQVGAITTSGEFTTARLSMNRLGEDASVQATYWAPPGILTDPAPRLVVVCGSEGQNESDTSEPPGSAQHPSPLVAALLQRGLAALVADWPAGGEPPDQFAKFFTTYNRTKLQQRVRDLLTLCAAASSADPRKPMFFRTTLLGKGRAGLSALLAAPAADAVVADCDQLDAADDEALLAPDLFCPGLRNLGAFEGVAMLAAPHPLLLHNTGVGFPTDKLASTYKAIGAGGKLRVERGRLSDEELAKWVAGMR
jgi:hypothetical protein